MKIAAPSLKPEVEGEKNTPSRPRKTTAKKTGQFVLSSIKNQRTRAFYEPPPNKTMTILSISPPPLHFSHSFPPSLSISPFLFLHFSSSFSISFSISLSISPSISLSTPLPLSPFPSLSLSPSLLLIPNLAGPFPVPFFFLHNCARARMGIYFWFSLLFRVNEGLWVRTGPNRGKKAALTSWSTFRPLQPRWQ